MNRPLSWLFIIFYIPVLIIGAVVFTVGYFAVCVCWWLPRALLGRKA